MTDDLLTAPEELALVRVLRGSDDVHKSTVHRARRDPAHPAHQRPDGTFTDPRTTSNVEGLAVVIRAPRDTITTFWANRRLGRPARTPAQEETNA